MLQSLLQAFDKAFELGRFKFRGGFHYWCKAILVSRKAHCRQNATLDGDAQLVPVNPGQSRDVISYLALTVQGLDLLVQLIEDCLVFHDCDWCIQ